MQHNINLTHAALKLTTHEGGRAAPQHPLQELRRTVLNCLLWENTFYEDGIAVEERIKSLCLSSKIKISELAALAVEARAKYFLRHVPLIIIVYAARRPRTPKENVLLEQALVSVCDRADQVTEFLSLYWKDGKCPLTHFIKRGLGRALANFDAYHLGKYNRDKAVGLRDVMFLVHAKPIIKEESFRTIVPAINKQSYKRGETMRHLNFGANFTKLAEKSLESPDTWEVRLSAAGKKGAEETKKAVWESLLTSKGLGALAFIRNLRNMDTEGVSKTLIKDAFKNIKFSRIFPYQFISAAEAAPWAEPLLEPVMMACLEGSEKLEGNTLLLVDTSGSMSEAMSGKSKMRRFDAAAGLAVLLREVGVTEVYSFNTNVVLHPPRHGFALRDTLKGVLGGGTMLGGALAALAKEYTKRGESFSRVIVITDEQSSDNISSVPNAERYYIINVASFKNGIACNGKFTKIDGFSENVVKFIIESERAGE